MKANQMLSQGNNKYFFKVKGENNTKLYLNIMFIKLFHHSEMKDPWADMSLVFWRREAKYNSHKQSVLAIIVYAPREAKSGSQGKI